MVEFANITNENGAVTKRQDFAAFGDETLTAQRAGGLGYTSTDELRQDYTGYQKDNESGLEYAQARYYNTAHGRFTSVDPLTASATIRDPQSFNRYSYVLNSPYKFTDPLGLIPGFVNNSGGSYCSAAASNCDFGGHLDGSWFDDSAPTQDSAGSSASEPQTGIESAGLAKCSRRFRHHHHLLRQCHLIRRRRSLNWMNSLLRRKAHFLVSVQSPIWVKR
ncbi:MAG: RHS repeat-associated core domain-containing protein [Acidobacteria bacterium]|nr:RHS repeat-associated core domain-containing protein [Acidobacteriota bacterium]